MSRIALYLTSSIMLIGCSSQQIIPGTGQEILTTYEQHTSSNNEIAAQERALRSGRRDLRAYTRNATNEISLTFPRLPNPELSLYVYPHFTRKGHPVLGYSSAFLFYEKTEYALPGELVQ